jgi:hypothetical protein
VRIESETCIDRGREQSERHNEARRGAGTAGTDGPTDVGTTDAVLELPRGLVLPVVLLTEHRYL